MKKIILTMLAVPFLVSCASMMPKPLEREAKTVEKIEETKLSKQEAFKRVSSYLAKNLGDSNTALKVRDENAGQIIGQMIVSCDELSSDPFGLVSASAFFVVELNFKDKKMKMSATADHFLLSGGKGPDTRADFYENNIGKAKVCAERLFQKISTSLEKESSSNW